MVNLGVRQGLAWCNTGLVFIQCDCRLNLYIPFLDFHKPPWFMKGVDKIRLVNIQMYDCMLCITSNAAHIL